MPLVAHWPLHEGSGSTAYDVRGGNDGSLNGGVTQGTNGILGTSTYDFDGTDDYVDLTGSSLNNFNRFTLSGWVNIDETTSTKHIIRLRENNDCTIRATDTGEYELQIYDGSSSQLATGGSGSTGSWQHIVGTWDGQNMVVYVDGVEVATGSASNVGNASGQAHIGANGFSSTGEYMDGRIADVRVYDHALSPLEVQYLYETGLSGTADTSWKSASSDGSGSLDLTMTASVPTNATLEATVLEDTDSDGVAENVATTTVGDGTNTYSLSGFSTTSGTYDYAVHFEFKNSDRTVASSVDVAEVSFATVVTEDAVFVSSTGNLLQNDDTSIAAESSTTTSLASPITNLDTASTTVTTGEPALGFDYGDQAYFDVTQSVIDAVESGQYSLLFWVRGDAEDGSTDWPDYLNAGTWRWEEDQDGITRVGMYVDDTTASGATQKNVGNIPHSPGEIHSAAFTVDATNTGGTVLSYKNGGLVDDVTHPGTDNQDHTQFNSNWEINRSNGGSIRGAIGRITIYDRPLSQREVQHWHHGRAPSSGKLMDFPMDGSGTPTDTVSGTTVTESGTFWSAQGPLRATSTPVPTDDTATAFESAFTDSVGTLLRNAENTTALESAFTDSAGITVDAAELTVANESAFTDSAGTLLRNDEHTTALESAFTDSAGVPISSNEITIVAESPFMTATASTFSTDTATVTDAGSNTLVVSTTLSADELANAIEGNVRLQAFADTTTSDTSTTAIENDTLVTATASLISAKILPLNRIGVFGTTTNSKIKQTKE